MFTYLTGFKSREKLLRFQDLILLLLLLLPFLISAVLIGIVFIAAASHPEQNVQNVKNLHHKLDQHN